MGREVVAAAAAVQDLPVAGLRARVEQAMEHARVGVFLLDAHALREGVADDGHAHHAGPTAARSRTIAKLLRAVAALDGVRRVAGGIVEAGEPQAAVLLEGRGVAEVDVEVAARVAGVAVQQHRAPAVRDPVGVLEARGSVAGEPERAFGEEQDEESGRGGQAQLRAHARKRCHPCQ